MKGSLLLPIDSRKTSLIQVPKLDSDSPVENVPSVSLHSDIPDSSEIRETILEHAINRATTNAELNQLISSTFCPETSPSKLGDGRRSSLSVRFGNESDVEYDTEGDPRLFQTTVRSSKEFDGNRSGRKSAKQ